MGMQPPAPPPGSGDQPGVPPAYGGYQAPPPPGYQPYGQPAYGQPAYGGGEHPQGTTILVLGILSLVLCQILGPFAWSMGNKALREIDSSGRNYTNRGNIVAGRICGMISTILLIISVVIIVIAIIAAAASSS